MVAIGIHGNNAPTVEDSYIVGDKIFEDLLDLMRSKYNIVGGKDISYELRKQWENNANIVRESLRELVFLHDCDKF